MTRLFRAETAFFFLVWLLLLVALRERGFYDPGSLWHITVGEIILTTGMPQTDPFSFTFEGQPWVPQQWGAEVLMALGRRAGGLDLLLLGYVTLVALVFTLVFRRAVEGGMGWPLAALLVGACLAVGGFHFVVRPHMFTIVLLGWTMLCVVDFERGRCGVGRLAGLVPLYVVWTNLHGGVLAGTASLGMAVTGWGLLFLASGRRQPAVPRVREQPADDGRSPIRDWRTARILVGIVVACLLTPLVNPHGLEMIRIWTRLVGSKVLPQEIEEHMPLDPTRPVGVAVLGLAGLYVALLLGTLPKRPHVSWLIPLVWFVLTLKGIRQGPLFAVTAAVAIADLWPHTVWHRLLAKFGDGTLAHGPDAPRPLFAPLAIPLLVVLVAVGLQVTRTPVPVVGSGWVRLDPRMVPVDINDAVRGYAASVPPGTPIYNDANLGGYLIYHAPTLKIFMDDRCELFGDDWIKMYADTLRLPPEELGVVFEGWRAKWGFDRALIVVSPPEKDKSNIERYLLAHPERWREVARGKRAAMFEFRRDE